MSLSAVQSSTPRPPSCNGHSTSRKPAKTQRACSTVRESGVAANGCRSGKPPHLANRSTISSTLRAASPRHVSTYSGKRSSPQPARGSKDHVSEYSETTVASPSSGGTPLSSYTGPTPKSLDGVRAAFFETKGMSLESISEWESHCLHADMDVLSTAMKNKRITGTITGYDEAHGFTGTATTRGTLTLWLLSQAKFNGLKVLSLWARLGQWGPFLPCR